MLNSTGVFALQNVGGANARFYTTKLAPSEEKQGSIEAADPASEATAETNVDKRVHLRANAPRKCTPTVVKP